MYVLLHACDWMSIASACACEHPSSTQKMELHQTLALCSLVLSTSTKSPIMTQARSTYLRTLWKRRISDRFQDLLSQTQKVIQTPLQWVSENIKEVQLPEGEVCCEFNPHRAWCRSNHLYTMWGMACRKGSAHSTSLSP